MRAALSPEFQWVFNLTAETGSCMYMAPEVYRHEPYNCMAGGWCGWLVGRWLGWLMVGGSGWLLVWLRSHIGSCGS